MEPLLVLHKCKPHLKGPGVTNLLPTRTMVVFADDAIYVVGMNRDFIGSIVSLGLSDAGSVGDFVGGKLSDWRTKRVGNAEYAKFAEDIKSYVEEQEKVYRFEYSDLKNFVYRKKIRGTGGVINDYMSLQFDDKSFYLDVGDKDMIEPAIAIVEELAPNADVKHKRGAMAKRS